MKKFIVFVFRFLLFSWLVTFFITFSLLGIRWLTSMKYQLISTDLRLWEIYLPGILSICSIAFLVRPRFRERFNAIYTYKVDDWIKNGYILHLFMIASASFMLLSYSQKYFSGTYGDLITIKSLDEVSEHLGERFFKIDSITYNPYYGVFFENNTKRLIPEKFPKLTMNHYIVNPLHDSRKQYYKPPLTYWMALHTQRKVATFWLRKDNTILKRQRSQVYDQIDTYDISQVQYFYKSPASGLLDDYKEVIASRYGEKIARKAIVLEPKTYSFEDRSNHLESPLRIFILSFFMSLIPLLAASFANLKKGLPKV